MENSATCGFRALVLVAALTCAPTAHATDEIGTARAPDLSPATGLVPTPEQDVAHFDMKTLLGMTGEGKPDVGVGVHYANPKSGTEAELDVDEQGGTVLRLRGTLKAFPIDVRKLEYRNDSSHSSVSLMIEPLVAKTELDVGALEYAHVLITPRFEAKIEGVAGRHVSYSVAFHAGPMAGYFNGQGATTHASVVAAGADLGLDASLSYKLDEHNAITAFAKMDAYSDALGSLATGIEAQGGLAWTHKFDPGGPIDSLSFGPMVSYELFKIYPSEGGTPIMEAFITGLALTIRF